MKRLTDKRLAIPPGQWQEVTREEARELKEIPVPPMRDLYYRLSQIEDILGDEYDLDRLSVLCNQRMTMRDEVSQRFSLTAKIPLDRLRELVEADKEKRCFVSDIKLGGEVFYIPMFNGKPYSGIREGHAQAVSFTRSGNRIKIREHHPHNQDFMIGKTVFLTREEAQAALRREQE